MGLLSELVMGPFLVHNVLPQKVLGLLHLYYLERQFLHLI